MFIEQDIERKFLDQLSTNLASQLKTADVTTDFVTDKNRRTIKSEAQQPYIIKQLEQILELQRQNKSFASNSIQLDKALNNFISVHQYRNYYVITPQNLILASSDSNLNSLEHLNTNHAYFLNLIWKSETVISFPIKNPDTNESKVYLGTAISDVDGQLIGALIVSTSIQEQFKTIFNSAKVGITGETYAISRNGLLLTASRYNPVLRERGLIGEHENAKLNLNVDISMLTVNGQLVDEENSIYVNLLGYPNYAQIDVVGAIIYNPSKPHFIITELKREDAFSPIINIRQVSIISFLFYCCFLLYMIYLFNQYKSNLDQQKNQLETSKLRLRLAFENIPSGNIISDWNGNIEEFSKSAESIFGYTSEEVIGKNISLLMPKPHQTKHDGYLKKYLHTGNEKIIGSGGQDTNGLHKDGHIFPIHICIGTMVTDNELHFIASITDQTIQSKIKKQLYNFQKMKAIGQLAGGIAHDFNNLLGIAMGNLQLLERTTKLEGKSKNKVDTALQALDRGATLTRQLLNFTRADDTTTSVIDIRDGILGVQNLIEQTVSKKVIIEYNLTSAPGYIDVNYGDFGDALINLTSNSNDSMPMGGSIKIETCFCYRKDNQLITGEADSLNNYIQLTVSDTGEGISLDKLDNIFEPFYTTKERDKGTGLGLAMVYNFIKHSQGEIEVSSELGSGTVFKLFFPIAEETECESTTIERMETKGGDETILLVDDEEDLLTIAKYNLEDVGYRVICATTGDEALKIIKQNQHIDLVLTDIIMPGQFNGFELAVEAMSLSNNLKIALTSGFTAKASEKLINANLLAQYMTHNILPKPYNQHELLTFVRDNLNQKIYIQWQDDYKSGIVPLDTDHLVQSMIINRFYTAIMDDSNNVDVKHYLSELIEYSNLHLKREELILLICDYPDREEHCKLHIKKKNELSQLLQGQYSTQESKVELLKTLKSWLLNHIAHEDKQIAVYAAQHADEIYEALKKDLETSLLS